MSYDDDTIVNVFWERSSAGNLDRPAILYKEDGAFKPVSWRQHGRTVELVAGGLLSHSIKVGERVAILCNTCPYWTWADMAILSIAAVTVPVYPTLNPPEVEYILNHCGASALFVENNRQLAKVLSISPLPPQIRLIIQMEGDVPSDTVKPDGVEIICWSELLSDGEKFSAENSDALKDRLKEIHSKNLATIVYTSGTTGVPKGVMVTHRNIFYVCQTLSLNVGFHPDDVTLSFLPLSHIFERIGGQMIAIFEGLIMAYAESMDQVPQNLMEVRPTIMNAVPRFYEKAYNRIVGEIRKMPKAQQHMVRWALSLGKRAARQREAAKNGQDRVVDQIYRTELRIADRLVFSKIRKRFGGRLRFLVSGAAPLSNEVQQFFDTIGMPIVEGYGLTETAAPVACNKPGDIRRGTVGMPLPGLEVKIADDGEILVKGPSIFEGYYKDEAATKEAFKDGYFCTGDIGAFDKDGYLKILDRKKDLIITAGGKHVAPQYLESLFVGERLVSRVLVYGDRRKFITALFTLSPEGLETYAKLNNITHSSYDELVHHPSVSQEVARIVKDKNDKLATFEQIKKYAVLDNDFSIENNELTPTLKMRRKVIIEKYKAQLDSLYDHDDLLLEEGVQGKSAAG